MVTFVDGPVRVSVPATSANLGPGFDSLGPRPRPARRARGRGDRPAAWSVEVDGRRRRRRARATSRTSWCARCARRSTQMGAAAARAAAGLPQRHPARPRPRLVVGRDRRRASCLARGAGRRRHAADGRRRAVRPRRPARGPPRQRRARPSTAASSISGQRGRRRSTPSRSLGRPAGRARWCSCRRRRSPPRSPAGLLPAEVPHADAAADAGRTALLVAALAGQPEHLLPRDPRLPAPGVPPPGDARRRSPSSTRCAPTACPRSSPAPGRPCSPSPTAPPPGRCSSGARPAGQRTTSPSPATAPG